VAPSRPSPPLVPSGTPEGVWRPPAEFDEYRLIRPLGRGGHGQVYLAHDTLLERAVAVKFIPALDSTALARFLNEARAAARVQHPNVVTLYRVGQLDERAYLISEYTRGVSLDRVKKPLPWQKALKLSLELTRGLAAAHRRGVLHRDIKPGNVLLTDGGEVKLLDFGLAKLLDNQVGGPATRAATEMLSHAVSPDPEPDFPSDRPRLSLPLQTTPSLGPVGTPYYMSPEAWQGEEHTARSDLYSLGVMVYELCSGKGPFRDVPFEALPSALKEREPLPLHQLVPEMDAAFAGVVDKCLKRDPLARFTSADALLDALEAVAVQGGVGQVPEGNPYRGLRPFEAEHRALFYGRRRELSAVVERLRAEPFLLLTGDSGVGKSSLCAAGVLPAVREGALEDGRTWAVVRLVPGRRPLAALAAAAAPVMDEEEPRLIAELSAAPDSFARALRAKLGANDGLLLYIDQLEELVTLSSQEDAQRFAEVLAPLSSGLAGARLLATARSDFLTRLAGLPRLGEALSRALYLVRPLGLDEVREAVVGPARVKGVGFESEALVRTLVDSTIAAGGGLPLLQFALAQLWEARDKGRSVLTASALTALGGVAGALARHADGVIESLPPEQRAVARILLLKLVTKGGTRARRTEDELIGEDVRFQAALEALVRARLLVARDTEEGGTFELAHEALLNGWASLARWIAEEAKTRGLRERLDVAARDWERVGQTRDALWGPRQIAEATSLEEAGLPARERRFLEASRQAHWRARRLRQGLGVGFLLALVGAAGAVQLQAVVERHRASSADLARAFVSLNEARKLSREEDSSREESYRAFDAKKPGLGEERWARAQAASERVDQLYAEAAAPLEHALALGRDRQDVMDAMADYLLERAERAERANRLDMRDLFAQRLAVLDRSTERWRRWTAPAVLELKVPPGTHVSISRYGLKPDTQRLELEAVSSEAAPEGVLSVRLPPGSYLLSLSAPGRESVRYPVLLGRGEQRRAAVRLPKAGTVPRGYVYVPDGRFLFGNSEDEGIRLFLATVPRHPVELGAYLISQHETTWEEWLTYLDALPESERLRRTPRASSTGLYGALQLSKGGDGRWTLSLQPTGQLFRVRQGERLHYPGRRIRADVNWLNMPVTGIGFEDAQAYAAWLHRQGRLPGARLCTEMEWEAAARGADGRIYPRGNDLGPDDANFDLTYGKEPLAFGPDEVGSHTNSDSPFDVHDLAGNAWEWTSSALEPGKPVARGGAYYFGKNAIRADNRESPESSFRDLTVGLRLCAKAP